jgi:hypothetical protein
MSRNDTPAVATRLVTGFASARRWTMPALTPIASAAPATNTEDRASTGQPDERHLRRVDRAVEVAAEEDDQHEEGGDGAELALREVEHPRRPVDQRDPEGHERVHRAEREPVDQHRPERDAGGAEAPTTTRPATMPTTAPRCRRARPLTALESKGQPEPPEPSPPRRAVDEPLAACPGVAASGLLGCCLLRHRPTSRVDVLTGVRLPRSST